MGPRRWAQDDRAQLALLIAACDRTGRVDVVHTALSAAGLSPMDLDGVEDIGLLHRDGSAVAFRHPLVRAAVLDVAAPTRRRAAHAALAEALRDGPERADLATHVAAAASVPDTHVADALATLADALQADGAVEAASRAWRDAARLSPDPTAASRFTLAAVDAALGADLLESAEALARHGVEMAPSARDRGLLLTRLGVLVGVSRDIRAGIALLDEAMHLLDGDDRADALLELVSLHGLDVTARTALARITDDGRLPDSPRARCLHGSTLASLGRWDEGLPLLEVGLDEAPTPSRSWSPLALDDWVDACTVVGLYETRHRVAGYTTQALESGRPNSVSAALLLVALTSYLEGRWTDAVTALEERTRLLDALGRVDFNSAGMISAIAARRGDGATLTDATAAAGDVFDRTGNEYGPVRQPGTWGLYHLGRGELDAAEELLRRVHDANTDVAYAYNDAAAIEVALVELLSRTGRLPEARQVAPPLREVWRGCPSRLGRAWLARVEAAVADDDAAEQHDRAAIDALLPDVHEFALAQTRLYLGQWLRRRRRRGDAVEPLRLAQDAFAAMGCAPWLETCREELTAAGADVGRLERYDVTQTLTSQERRVAETVATGCSNAEAARRLFLSPKTIEVHLTHVYRKLAIPGRAELAAALGAEGCV